ncbi:MAG TPA: CocE/NonD family hydrolase [Chloroflexota bacterium]|nr:CocE/NonD family hydrolase [Chloroflexota bacterium]
MAARWIVALPVVIALCTPAAAEIQVENRSARVERNIFISMRDGVKLATDIHLPDRSKDGRVPVILLRTPYSKAARLAPISFFTQHGYAVAVQDKRGRFNSEGTYVPSGGDAADGYDTIEWLSRQPWSNGNIGGFGCSYGGDVQIFMAGTRHPALKALIPQASGSSVGSLGGHYRYFGTRVGGATELIQSIGWFAQNGQKVAPRLPTDLPRDFYNSQAELWAHARTRDKLIDLDKAWSHLPVIDALSAQGMDGTDYEDTIGRPVGDPYWSNLPYMTSSYRSDVTALFINSWYDFGADMTMLQFRHFRDHSLSSTARENQYVIMSPHAHCEFESGAAESTQVGERDLGDTRFDYRGTYRTWFDAWLKEDPAAKQAIRSWPKIRYFAMGRNEWQSGSDWPLPASSPRSFFLASGGDANSLRGGGRLRLTPPAVPLTDTYTYDPANPVPSRGGSMCCTGTPEAIAGALDQRPVQGREDVLVYTSAPLREPTEVTGNVELVLYVSSDAGDTDFTAKLTDMYPDGRAFNILEGIVRAQHRHGQEKSVPLNRGEVYEIKIPLGATSNVFLKGHRVRLEVSSSNFPRFDRNLNLGGDNVRQAKYKVARNTVYHGPKLRSRLILPVVERKAGSAASAFPPGPRNQTFR